MGDYVLREEKKAEKRQELVDACLDCFVEKGLTVATTKDLCKAAKLQNGGIYYYFSTKEEIVLACAEEAISRIISVSWRIKCRLPCAFWSAYVCRANTEKR